MIRPSRISAAILGYAGVVAIGGGYLCVQAAWSQDPAPPRPVAAEARPVSPVPSAAPTRALLDKYCVTCHNERLKTAGLALDRLDPERVEGAPDVWEKVARKLRTHEMPPPGRPRPDLATYSTVTASLESALDRASAANPNPGRVGVHRLNRTEYTHAVRDLLGLTIDGRSLLPEDEPDRQSFENIASVLTVSPALLERYLTAASEVSRLAIGDTAFAPVVTRHRLSPKLVQEERTSNDLPFGSRGGAAIRYHFPLDGDYTVKVVLKRQLYDYLMGMGEPHQIDVRLDGALIKRFTVGGEAKGYGSPETFAGNTQGDDEWEVYMHTADAGLEVRFPVKAGTREVGVSFVRNYWEAEGIVQPPQRGFAKTTNEQYYGNPGVDTIFIGGPYQATGADESVSRRKVFLCRPSDRLSEDACARQILSTLARRAYRRPVTERDLERLLTFYKVGKAEGGFDTGIRRGVERILAAPSFLFRVQHEPAKAAPGSVYRLTDLDLASRLSFFLWSSIPDEELLDVAVRGKLSDPAVLSQQVRRMLSDARSKALVENFANQWLKLGKIAGVVPDVDQFPDFDENLREAMQQETQLFFASQLRENRSVLELLTANYTFVNERLAKHYQIPNVYGNHFRRVTFDDGRRGGLLAQASVLTVTSYPNRTSPVVRGKWLLETMLGSPPPPPPDNVEPLRESDKTKPQSVRERMETHRRNPACAVCHVRMDPLGFSLENFDALGKWRTVSDGAPIDVAASLPDGTKFEGLDGLRALLVSHKAEFVGTLTEKLLSYAIGRGVEYYDLPTVRAIGKATAADNYRWAALITEIVKSKPFTMGIVRGASSPESVAVAASAPAR
jgi:hypothetical protein